ncbi:MAG: hemolysin family protein, partial [Acetatifactor sp.]|nr:hemolysin family protein [Acetatifactor sp.]
MDDSGPTASIIFLFLVLIDMFFHGFGAAVEQLNSKEVEKKAQEDKDRRSQRLLKILEDPTRYVNSMQLVITLNNIVMGGVYLGIWLRVVSDFLTRFAEQKLSGIVSVPLTVITVFSVVVTMIFLLYILLTFGVLLPKKIARRLPEKWAYASINIVYVVMKLLTPFTGLVTVSANLMLRLFGVRNVGDEADVTEEEIINMVNEGHEQGIIQTSEAEMISNIFEFGDKESHDIMTHRNNIVALDGSMPLKDALDFLAAGKNSRYPVYEENMDHIVGILYLKDAMRYHHTEDKLYCSIGQLTDLLREPVYIPQTRNIDELFRQMQSDKLQMVIVVDEYGQTAGLVTMEDILEEIVGNILDEYDEDEDFIEEKGNDEYVIEGKTPLEDLEERVHISFHEEDFETLNGLMIA